MATEQLDAEQLAWNELCQALAEDLQQLIRLHDVEIDTEVWAALQQVEFPWQLSFLPQDAAGQQMLELLGEAVVTPPNVDELAADFAAIYLTAAYGTSPYESVWVTDEHLTAQQPMFEWRDIYAADGLQLDPQEQRYADHLVLQLIWLHEMLHQPFTVAAWQRILPILDEHLLYWLPDWAAQVVKRADTAFYAGLAGLSVTWLQQLRQQIGDYVACPIPSREAMTAKIQAKLRQEAENVQPIRFMPGAHGPSW